MKKVIDGKTYNTDTATKIGHDSFSNKTDFHYFSETLYKTKKGRYFIAGKGGALSRWRVDLDHGGWGGGSGIVALSQHEALSWCEEHDVDADIIAEHFDIEDA